MIKLAALALLAVTQPAEQFDLICVGSAWESPTGGAARPAEYRFRIDLARNRWCEGDCAQPREIQSVTEDRYTLVNSEYRGRGLRTLNTSWIDRVAGTHTELNLSTGGLVQGSRREGRCERAPFSGMPQPRL